jgi:hypothetical protein
MGVVQLDTVKSDFARALRCGGKYLRQDLRQLFDVGQIGISDAFAITEAEGFEFASVKNLIENVIVSCLQEFAKLRLISAQPV